MQQQSNQPLRDKIAVVTGGSRGIGRAISLTLASQGADIAILYAGNTRCAEETAAEIRQMGRRAAAYLCDVGSFEQTKTTVAAILDEMGSVDILVNNAGITRDGLVLSMSEQDFDDVLDSNLKGAFHMIKHLYPCFMKKREGRIINIASVSGIMGNAGQANYSSAKAGLIGLTKTVARELASRRVTCNAVAPGFIKTQMTDQLSDAVKDRAAAQIPLKRMGEPEDVAELVAFLAGSQANYITGEIIKVDGGLCI